MITPELVGDKFARIFFLIVLGIFLCPKSSPTVSHQFYESICRVREINSYDWCTAVSECLHLGLMNFQTNARKGNTRGKSALGGNIFDYLVLDSAFLEPTLPRIRVWDDNAISSYSGAELGIQNIEFKPMEETLFNKHQMALASIRGFDITGWDQPPIKSTSHAPCNATNNQPEIMLQDVESRLNEIVVYLSERKLGFRLDNADLVFVPLRKSAFWILLLLILGTKGLK